MKQSDAFDYVVVGGGTAGSVVASRLVQAGASVCLIEAGGAPSHPYFAIPSGFAKLLGAKRPWLPQANWGYSTVPQRHLNGRVLWYPQAKVLGGGSSINAMIYTRGHPTDYETWSRLGANGWSYSDVLPYFRKAEANHEFSDDFHGRHGPLRVSRAAKRMPISEAFVEAGVAAGLPLNTDFNGATQEGVGFHQTTTSEGRRVSTASAYLASVAKSAHLRLIANASVRRIMFTRSTATGVEYRLGNSPEALMAHARQEVICCAGAIGSPKLLLLSGVGAADELAASGIAVQHDLPGVGRNLQDHFDAYLVYDCAARYGFPGTSQPLTELAWALRYLFSRSGPLASNFVEAGAFVRVAPDANVPDVQFHLLPAYVVDSGRKRIRGYGVSLYTNSLRPRSRGTVRLASSDPDVPPLIDPNFLADPHDLELAVRSLERAREVMNASPMRELVAGERFPGPAVASVEALADYVRSIGKTDYHPVGTCRMGSDPDSVVDPTLRVRGVDRLRIVDASVMPTIIAGNTSAPTIMIAEKAADMILERSVAAAAGTSAGELGAV